MKEKASENIVKSQTKQQEAYLKRIQKKYKKAVAKNPEERGIVKMYCSTRKSNSRAGTYSFGSFL